MSAMQTKNGFVSTPAFVSRRREKQATPSALPIHSTQNSRPPKVGVSVVLSDLPVLIGRLADEGRDVEIWDCAEPHFFVSGWRECAKRTQEIVADFPGRISIHGPYESLTLFAHDPLIAAVVSDRLRSALYFAAEIGATQIVIHSPFTTFGSPYIPFTNPAMRRNQFEAARMVLGPLLPMAEEAGCAFVIENIYDSNPEPLLDLVASFHSPWVRMSLDIGHAFITHQIGGPPPDHWIAASAPFLAHMHLHDTDGLADRHWAIGQGSIQWRAVFAALSECPLPPRLILEMKKSSDIGPSLDWLAYKGFAE